MEFVSYHRPKTIAALYEALRQEPAEAVFLSGCTDVLVQDRASEKFAGKAAFDLTAIHELKQITEEPNVVRIGAELTHGAIAECNILQRYAPPLCAACSQVGAAQLRNRATISGNIGNASPAGDSLGPLVALDATVELDYLGTRRWLPVTELIERPGKLCLQEREFIREIKIPKMPEGMQWRFRKVGRRQALAISRLTLTVLLTLESDGTIGAYRAAVGAVFPRPMRFPEWERQYRGQKLEAATAHEMAVALAQQIPEISGVRSSTRYKQPVTQLLCERFLMEMLADAEAEIGG